MTIDDGRKILDGPQTAATDYFKSKTTARLTTAFSPVVHRTMARSGSSAAPSTASSRTNPSARVTDLLREVFGRR